MSANFHTPIPISMPVTTANLESPLSELDSAIGNIRDGAIDFHQLNLGSFSSKTISSGAISVNTALGDRTLVTVDTESSAATDDLDTITGSVTGDVLILKIANNSRIVTLVQGSGNIVTWNDKNVILTDTNMLAILCYNGSNWLVLPTNNQITSYAGQTATIASGAITFISTIMTIDTEGAASSDDLDTINGGVEGALLILKTANSSRDIRVTNSGNVVTSTGASITLSTTNSSLLLVYNALTSKWNNIAQAPILINSTYGTNNNAVSALQFEVPNQLFPNNSNNFHPLSSTTKPYLDIMPQGGLRQPRVLSACNTTLEGFGFGTLTVSGTPTNNFGDGGSQAPGSLVRFASGASSGNLGGVISPFTLTSSDCDPYFRIVFKTYANVSTCRFWIGLSSAAIGNTDTPNSGGTSFMGIRYSTVAGDSFWTFVTADGVGNTIVTTASTTPIDTDTTYELILSCDNSFSGIVSCYFRDFANSTYDFTNMNSSLPPSGTALGLNARVETREAVAKSLQIYGVALYH